jgi:hypothetical protein
VSGDPKDIAGRDAQNRDFAMHASWGKISDADVNSVIGFVEQFLGEHKNPGASRPGNGEPCRSSVGTAGRLTRDPSPQCGLSTHFFMLSHHW